MASKDPAKRTKQSREWYANNKDRAREIQRTAEWKRRGINITHEEYLQKFISQDGCCSLCNIGQQDLKHRLAVDHNHETGLVRDLLCHRCNMVLGNVAENTELLLKMVDYINKHK